MITEEIVAMTFDSRIEAIAEATAAATRYAGRFGYDEAAIFGIDMAVREAVTNAVVHGNGQDAAKPVELTCSIASDLLTISVRDRGIGFDPETVPDPTAEQNLLNASGRGILFMRNFMDTVEWTTHPEGGTIVRMTKKRTAA